MAIKTTSGGLQFDTELQADKPTLSEHSARNIDARIREKDGATGEAISDLQARTRIHLALDTDGTPYVVIGV